TTSEADPEGYDPERRETTSETRVHLGARGRPSWCITIGDQHGPKVGGGSVRRQVHWRSPKAGITNSDAAPIGTASRAVHDQDFRVQSCNRPHLISAARCN